MTLDQTEDENYRLWEKSGDQNVDREPSILVNCREREVDYEYEEKKGQIVRYIC